jgi:hypothetical protein
MIVNLILCWLIWVMVFFAQKTYPLIPKVEEQYLAEMQDRESCILIISMDDILSLEDLQLFMRVLRVLDFLYHTIVPALATFIGLYMLNNLS